MQKRIVSFLPSATEILYDLGVGDQIVGVTHECNFPDDAKTKPRVIRSSFDHTKMNSKEIDTKIIELVKTGGDIYVIDEAKLTKSDPDIIIAQGLCEVCSPYTREINKAVSLLNNTPEIIILEPHNIGEILTNIAEIGKRLEKTKEAASLIASLQRRIDYVKNTAKRSQPKVLCIEWLDPLFTAGHWIPEMVQMAGGINGISLPNESSRRMKIEDALDFDPDIIVLMPCGFGLPRIKAEYKKLASNTKWKNMKAVKNDKVHAVDANSYFSKPSPRTITGLEILAKIIHPDTFYELKVPQNSYEKLNQ